MKFLKSGVKILLLCFLTTAAKSQDVIDVFLQSAEFRRISSDKVWSNLGSVDRGKCYINYPGTGPKEPIIHVVFVKNNQVTAIIEAIKSPLGSKFMPNNENYAIALRIYEKYDFQSKSGTIKYYDLNYENHLAGIITAKNANVVNWETFDIPANVLAKSGDLRKKPHFCDKNQNGNITFTECYQCFKNACSGNPGCDTMCDILGFGSYCIGTFAASCVIISIFR